MRCTSVLVPHPTCTAGRSPCRPCRSRQHLPSRLPGGSGCRWSQDRTPAFPRWGCFIGGGAGKAGLQGHVTKRTLCKLRKRYPGPWEPLIRGLWPSGRIFSARLGKRQRETQGGHTLGVLTNRGGGCVGREAIAECKRRGSGGSRKCAHGQGPPTPWQRQNSRAFFLRSFLFQRARRSNSSTLIPNTSWNSSGDRCLSSLVRSTSLGSFTRIRFVTIRASYG